MFSDWWTGHHGVQNSTSLNVFRITCIISSKKCNQLLDWTLTVYENNFRCLWKTECKSAQKKGSCFCFFVLNGWRLEIKYMKGGFWLLHSTVYQSVLFFLWGGHAYGCWSFLKKDKELIIAFLKITTNCMVIGSWALLRGRGRWGNGKIPTA